MAAALSGQWTVVPAASWPFGLLLTAALGLALLAASRLVNRPLGLIALGAVGACLPLLAAVAGRRAGYMLPISVPTLALVLFAFALVALYIEVERRRTRLLTHHLESFLPRDLAREIARQNPSGESLGKPGSGVVMALRVVGLERWCAAVDSLKALGLVHAISSLAEKQARLHGGTLEHVQGDTLLLVWPGVALASVQSAVQAGRGLQSELGALLGSNESEGFPLGLRMAIESGPFLLAVAGSRTSRRSLILGAAVDTVLAMLPLCEELASPLLMGQQAAQTGPRVTLQHMGQFWLPDAGQPQSLYRIEP
jgi:class 3 adenylate cyclase